MLIRSKILASIFFLTLIFAAPITHAQELGPLHDYGEDGRLYSRDQDEHYLLSRQSYGTEDSTGYEGQIRIKKNYPGGGYEVQTFRYLARCGAVDGETMIKTLALDDPDKELASVRIDPKKRPGPGLKNAYNLFWAACHEQFRKFK
jgi:hypothetical protein